MCPIISDYFPDAVLVFRSKLTCLAFATTMCDGHRRRLGRFEAFQCSDFFCACSADRETILDLSFPQDFCKSQNMTTPQIWSSYKAEKSPELHSFLNKAKKKTLCAAWPASDCCWLNRIYSELLKSR